MKVKELEPIKTIDGIYEIREIVKGVYDIDESGLATMYLIEGRDRGLIIDLGVGLGDFKSVIGKLTSLPYDIVISHAHVDHIGGRGQFDKMFIHKDDVELISSVTMRYRKFFSLAFRKKRNIKTTLIPVDKEPEAIPIEDGHIFDLGGRTVKAILTPGHTFGSLCFHLIEDKVLLTVDSFNPILFLFLKNADTVENYLKGSEKVLSIPDIKIYWGSHLRRPINLDIMKTTIENAKYIFDHRKNTKRRRYRIRRFNGSLIVYRTDRIHNH